MSNKIWVVVLKTCSECNYIGTAVFDHSPTEVELDMARMQFGGGTCLNQWVFETKINGSVVDQRQGEY